MDGTVGDWTGVYLGSQTDLFLEHSSPPTNIARVRQQPGCAHVVDIGPDPGVSRQALYYLQGAKD